MYVIVLMGVCYTNIMCVMVRICYTCVVCDSDDSVLSIFMPGPELVARWEVAGWCPCPECVLLSEFTPAVSAGAGRGRHGVLNLHFSFAAALVCSGLAVGLWVLGLCTVERALHAVGGCGDPTEPPAEGKRMLD